MSGTFHQGSKAPCCRASFKAMPREQAEHARRHLHIIMTMLDCCRFGGKVWYRGPNTGPLDMRISNKAAKLERQQRLKVLEQRVLDKRIQAHDQKAQEQRAMSPARNEAVHRRDNPLFTE